MIRRNAGILVKVKGGYPAPVDLHPTKRRKELVLRRRGGENHRGPRVFRQDCAQSICETESAGRAHLLTCLVNFDLQLFGLQSTDEHRFTLTDGRRPVGQSGTSSKASTTP